MARVEVTPVEEALAALRANPDGFFEVQFKNKETKYKGTIFANAKFTIPGKRVDPWFNATNIKITRGVADPEDQNDKRNEFTGTRNVLQTTVRNSGAFGEFIDELDRLFTERIAKLRQEQPAKVGDRRTHGLVQRTTSNGEPIDDPIIRIKVDWGTYPAQHPIGMLRNQPKVQFLKAEVDPVTKQAREVEGRVTPPNGTAEVPVNADNLHLFATTDSMITKIRFTIPSIAFSQMWVSMPIIAHRVVINPATGGWSDEIEIENDIIDDATDLATETNTTVPDDYNSSAADDYIENM